MLIFGKQASKIGTVKLFNTKCNYCENKDTQIVSIYSKYAHLFWIPMFPIGEVLVVECNHCKKTVSKNEITKEILNAYELEKNNVKKPLWLWSGLLILGGFMLMMILISVFVISTVKPDNRKALLSSEELLLSQEPLKEKDTISNMIKTAFDSLTLESIHPEDFKYHTRVLGDKALILLQIPKLKRVEKEARSEAIEIIEIVCDEIDSLKNKKLYIGVKGKYTYLMYKTPTKEDSGRLIDESPLLDFYGDAEIQKH